MTKVLVGYSAMNVMNGNDAEHAGVAEAQLSDTVCVICTINSLWSEIFQEQS